MNKEKLIQLIEKYAAAHYEDGYTKGTCFIDSHKRTDAILGLVEAEKELREFIK